MLDAEALTWTIAGVIGAAVAVGWLLHVVWSRMGPGRRTAAARHSVLAERLLAAEEARHRAEAEAAKLRRHLDLAKDLVDELEARGRRDGSPPP